MRMDFFIHFGGKEHKIQNGMRGMNWIFLFTLLVFVSIPSCRTAKVLGMLSEVYRGDGTPKELSKTKYYKKLCPKKNCIFQI